MKLSSRPYKETIDILLNMLKAGREFIQYDLETSGLKSSTSKILSCSAIKYKYEDGRFTEIDRIDQFINPCLPIPEEASKVNGITNERVANEPDEWEAFEKILFPFFGTNPILGGYNIEKFDNKFMEALWLRAGGEIFKPDLVVDVMRMVQEKMNLKSSTLENAATELGANVGIQFHSSIDDVMVSQRVMELLIPTYYDAKEPAEFRCKGYDCHYQYYSHKNERIYVVTYPKSDIYYDVYTKKWDGSNCVDGFNLEDVKQDVLRVMGVEDEKSLVKLMREKEKNTIDIDEK